MSNTIGVKITGLGIYVPERILTNKEVAAQLKANRQQLIDQGVNLTPEEYEQFETSDEWIFERTGIEARRIAGPDEATSDLAVKAMEKALEMARLNKELVDFVILATVSPDHLYSPATASLVQEKIGLLNSAAVDISAACSSFVYGLALGYGWIKSGLYRKGIVIGADVMTRTVNWNDRAFSVLLGDGAGALVLEAAPLTQESFVQNSFFLGSEGKFASSILTPAGGSRQPLNFQIDPLSQPHKLWMDGREVFKLMVRLVPKKMDEALQRFDLNWSEIDLVVLHQANLRIIERVVERLKNIPGFRAEFFNNIAKYGNTTSASVLLCLAEAWQERILKPGMKVMVVTFGGGITWGITVIKWPVLE